MSLPVTKTIEMDGDFIVLLDPEKSHERWTLHNLFRLRTDGTIVWTIHQSEALGHVRNVELEYGRIIAWTWTHMLEVNKRNGKIKESWFTK